MVSNSDLASKTGSTNTPEIAVNETPIKWCSVTLSDVIGRGKRLEASVFDVEAKQARSIVTNGKYSATYVGGANGLATSYTGARFKRIWVEKSDMPIYQPSTIMDIKPTPDGYISKLTKTDIPALRVKNGQVLMTCSGTIGKVAYVSRTMNDMIFSHDLLRIDCVNPDHAGYLYTYFKSQIGNKILLTNSYGAVITHIEPEHLATVPIPDAPDALKKRIHDLIVASYELRDESNDLLVEFPLRNDGKDGLHQEKDRAKLKQERQNIQASRFFSRTPAQTAAPRQPHTARKGCGWSGYSTGMTAPGGSKHK